MLSETSKPLVFGEMSGMQGGLISFAMAAERRGNNAAAPQTVVSGNYEGRPIEERKQAWVDAPSGAGKKWLATKKPLR